MEKKEEERHFRFVLRYYQEHKLDTQKALEIFRHRQGFAATNKKRNSRLWGIGTAVAAALATAFILYLNNRNEIQWHEIEAETRMLACTLPDSSHVTLYPHSSLRYAVGRDGLLRHEISMEGKAAFQVKHDEARPFRVSGRLAQVEVLGTVFTVDELSADTACVMVDEGCVRFSSLKGQSDGIVLTAGMEAQLTKGQPEPKLKRVTGTFVFDRTPLAEVLVRLSKYYKVKLDAPYTDKRLTARFERRTLDEILETIEQVLDVEIKRTE